MDHRGNEAEAGYTDHSEIAAPATPASGSLRVYAKTDHAMYTKDSTGTETKVGSGSGGGVSLQQVWLQG